MKIIKSPVKLAELQMMAAQMFGDMVKAVVDIKQEVMAVDAELHADEEALLLENKSEQSDLWGINLYPEFFGQDDFIEYHSMINLRPGVGNNSMEVENPKVRLKIREVVKKLIES